MFHVFMDIYSKRENEEEEENRKKESHFHLSFVIGESFE